MIRMKRAKLDKKGKGKDTTESKKPTASMQMLDLFVDKVTNQKVYPWICKSRPFKNQHGSTSKL